MNNSIDYNSMVKIDTMMVLYLEDKKGNFEELRGVTDVKVTENGTLVATLSNGTMCGFGAENYARFHTELEEE